MRLQRGLPHVRVEVAVKREAYDPTRARFDVNLRGPPLAETLGGREGFVDLRWGRVNVDCVDDGLHGLCERVDVVILAPLREPREHVDKIVNPGVFWAFDTGVGPRSG